MLQLVANRQSIVRRNETFLDRQFPLRTALLSMIQVQLDFCHDRRSAY
jgi:hypothetical protein